MVSHRAMRRGFAMLDAILGGVLLAVGLAAVVTLASRSLQMERRGEREVVAAALLDEILSEVLVEGPVDYPKVFDTAGACEAPFEDWEFEVVIEAQGLGDPHRVTAIVRDPAGGEHRCATLMAPRTNDEPRPTRKPTTPLDRDQRNEERRLGSV